MIWSATYHLSTILLHYFLQIRKRIRKEQIMEMTYDGALVMPKSFAAVSEEEMTYVEGGGYYMTNEDCKAFAFALGVTISSSSTAIYSALVASGGTLAGLIGQIPVLGQIAAIIGVGYIIAQGKEFTEALCGALAQDKGIDISLGWYWCVPRMKFTVQ